MKKILFVLFLFASTLTTVEAKYLKLPDGSFYEIHAGKYQDDTRLWYCVAYSKYPNAFYMKAPTDCGSDFYKKFEEYYFEMSGKNEKLIQAVPLLQNGDWFLNERKLSGYEMFCDAYTRSNQTKNNAEYQRERDYFCARNKNSSLTNRQITTSDTLAPSSANSSVSNSTTDLGQAISNALQTDLLRTALMIGFFFLLTIGVSIKNLSKPSHCGRWWGALLGSIIAVLLMFKNLQPVYSNTWFQIIGINFTIFYGIGFLIAYFWRKFRNKSSTHVANLNDDSLWAQALSETEGTNRENGLWAKCLAESNGVTEVAKAIYIKLRVKQLKNKA